MKAEELMIGDFVQVKGEVLLVGGISTYDICVDLFRDDEDDVYLQIWAEELDVIEPIPLTPEILEKNGFEEKMDFAPYSYFYFFLKDSNNRISLEKNWDSDENDEYWGLSIGNRLCDISVIAIHYVHELQHALRLCGNNKEIEL